MTGEVQDRKGAKGPKRFAPPAVLTEAQEMERDTKPVVCQTYWDGAAGTIPPYQAPKPIERERLVVPGLTGTEGKAMYDVLQAHMTGGLSSCCGPKTVQANDPRLASFNPTLARKYLSYWDLSSMYATVQLLDMPAGDYGFIKLGRRLTGGARELREVMAREAPAGVGQGRGSMLVMDLEFPEAC